MITIEQYWAGRDSKYRGEWTEQIQKNGIETVSRGNGLLLEAEADGIFRDKCTSGWRPKSVNDATANAGKVSRHIEAKAEDIEDDETRAFQYWCVTHPDRLCKYGLWMEHPGWCAKWDEKLKKWVFWVHLQTEPPASGKRIYIPSNTPIILSLPGYGKGTPVRIKL